MKKTIYIFAIFGLLPGASFCGDLNGRAFADYLEGNLTKAAREYEEAAGISGNDAMPLLNAAMVYKQLDRYDDAVKLMQKAFARDPQNADILSETGWLKFHLADYEGALPYFEKALTLNPNNHRAVLGNASAWSQLGDIIKTVEYLQKYRELRKDFAGVDYIFAWNYVNFKMYEKAQEHLIIALRKDPSFVEARLPLAGIYLREEKYNEAWNQYYRVLDYAPHHPEAESMIKKIRGKLTKQPEDIRPPFKILKPTIVEHIDAINELKKSPKIRVGVGANNKGEQGTNREIRFRSFGRISVIGKKTRKEYAKIRPGEIWKLKFEAGKVSLFSDKGIRYGSFPAPILLVPGDKKNGTIIFEADRNSANPYFRYSDREYRGYMEIYPIAGRGIGLVNVVELEIYLMGVVPSEMEPQWPYEALKAQSVIARTQAILRAQSGPHKKHGYHICDTEHCQVYKGVNIEANSTDKAILDTEGEILTYHGRVAYTFYHSNCGGHIQASKEVAGWGEVPYLTSHADAPGNKDLGPWEFNLWMKDNPPAYCNYPGTVSGKEFRWMKIIKKKDLEFKLNRDYGIGELIEIIPMKRSLSGNVNSIKVIGKKKTIVIRKEHLIRNAFGFSSLKSTLFLMETNRFKNRKIRNFWFYGGGWGHGIGLCQSGAAGMAGKENKKYEEILRFYFPQTKIRKLKYIKKK